MNKIRFTILVTKNNGMVHRYQKGAASRLGQVFKASFGKHWDISVTYPDGGYNEGEYDNGQEALKAFKAFIDG